MEKNVTSTSLTKYHPDKICDQIADHIIDAGLLLDKKAILLVEVAISRNTIKISVETNTEIAIEYEMIARNVLKKLNIDQEMLIEVDVDKLDAKEFIEERNNGIVYGYAVNETSEFMPIVSYTAHLLSEQLDEINLEHNVLKGSGKITVSYDFDEDKIPYRISKIIVDVDYHRHLSLDELEEVVLSEVIEPIVKTRYIDEDTKILINNADDFIPQSIGETSATLGAHNEVDHYGTSAQVSEDHLSGLSPYSLLKAATYYARFIAKNIVANGLCEEIEIKIDGTEGYHKPLKLSIDTKGTNHLSEEDILKIINSNFNLSLENMLEELDLLSPVYHQTSNYGHFGKPALPWEKLIELIL